MGLASRIRRLCYHIAGRDKFKYQDVGEAFTEWSRRTRDALVYLKQADNGNGNRALIDNCTADIKRQYDEIVDNMPPQDIRKLNRLIRNCGIDIVA